MFLQYPVRYKLHSWFRGKRLTYMFYKFLRSKHVCTTAKYIVFVCLNWLISQPEIVLRNWKALAWAGSTREREALRPQRHVCGGPGVWAVGHKMALKPICGGWILSRKSRVTLRVLREGSDSRLLLHCALLWLLIRRRSRSPVNPLHRGVRPGGSGEVCC